MTGSNSDTSDESCTDPLADAEPGETVTIEREIELSPWYQRAADDWVGHDRDVDSRLELVEVEDIGEQGSETLRATYRAEVTKLGEADGAGGNGQDASATEGGPAWWKPVLAFGAAGIGGALVSLVIGLGHLVFTLTLAGPALALAVIIVYGVQGALPGMAGNGGMGR